MINKKRVIVIGGGASGLVAAITAARSGAEVILLEQLQRVGKKILATGNGRCNLTNANIEIGRYHGKDINFFKEANDKFDLRKTLDFFEELGISCREEDCGKLYPWSGQATSVLDVLRYELKKLKIEERCEAEVIKIFSSKKGFSIKIKDGTELIGDAVILATGGKSNSNLGSTGQGYKLAENLGHKLIEPFPALVQLRLNSHYLKGLSGVKFIGDAAILGDNTILQKEKGEILFTDYGISGPPILQISRIAAESLRNKKATYLSLDLFPEFSYEGVIEIIRKKLQLDIEKPLELSLVGLLNKKLIPIILKSSGIADIHKLCGAVLDKEIVDLANNLKYWSFEVLGTQPWKDSQVTAGGIAVKDIDSKTMESKLIKGLYFSGEIMDIDGDCGGFNLQWAWSSGYIAGISAARV